MILPPLFFPPINWFLKAEQISLNGPLVKQSLMNRCWIKTPGQALALIVPVEHIGRPRSFQETRPVYRENWQIRMERTLETFYRKSAFFEHYFPEIQKIIHTRFDTLSELNMASVSFVFQALGAPLPPITESVFVFPETDFPPDPTRFSGFEKERFQLYGPFIPGLSVLDVLFHDGSLPMYAPEDHNPKS
jgi:hypothetical protein